MPTYLGRSWRQFPARFATCPARFALFAFQNMMIKLFLNTGDVTIKKASTTVIITV